MQIIVNLLSAVMGIALVPQSMSYLQRPAAIVSNCRISRHWSKPAWRCDNVSPVSQDFLELLRKK